MYQYIEINTNVMKNIKYLVFALIITSFTACDWFKGTEINSDGNKSVANLIGTVLDSQTLDPIVGARVIVSPGNLVAYSNNEGYYEFLDIPVGEYIVFASADYYANVEGAVDVPKEGLDLTVYMDRTIIEDYSSAIVESCDNRLKVDIVSCRRSGNKVEFKFLLTNVGFGDISQFTIDRNCDNQSIIFDDLGNQYEYQSITLGAQSNAYNGVSCPLLEYVSCKAGVTIAGVPNNAETLVLKLRVRAWDNVNGHLLSGENYITFKNVPIY